jgi:hypothetical protein
VGQVLGFIFSQLVAGSCAKEREVSVSKKVMTTTYQNLRLGLCIIGPMKL